MADYSLKQELMLTLHPLVYIDRRNLPEACILNFATVNT